MLHFALPKIKYLGYLLSRTHYINGKNIILLELCEVLKYLCINHNKV